MYVACSLHIGECCVSCEADTCVCLVLFLQKTIAFQVEVPNVQKYLGAGADITWHAHLANHLQLSRCSHAVLRQFGNIDSKNCLRLYTVLDAGFPVFSSKTRAEHFFSQVFSDGSKKAAEAVPPFYSAAPASVNLTEITWLHHHLSCISRIAGERLKCTRVFGQGMDPLLGDISRSKALAFEGLIFWLGHFTHGTVTMHEVCAGLRVPWEQTEYAAAFKASGLVPLYRDYYAHSRASSAVWVAHIKTTGSFPLWSASNIRAVLAKTGFSRSVTMAEVVHLGGGTHIALLVLPVELSLEEMESCWGGRFNRTAGGALMDGFMRVDPHTWTNFYMGMFANSCLPGNYQDAAAASRFFSNSLQMVS
jgi:hypothetical protein